MAKYGEGDKRWIVSDRPDGTNVHNWHWSETDCLDWSRNYLTKSFSNLPILTGESNLYISITAVDKIDGEAYVNIRKGKIIPGYELSVSLSWEGEARDQDGNSLLKTNGTVLIPYIADENAGEDPEVKVTVNDVGPIGGRLKETLLGKGKEVIFEKVRDFVECMAKGGPCKVGPNVGPNVGPSSAQKEVKKEQLVVEKEKEKEEKKKSKERKGFKTIKMSERFSCRAVDLYEIMMDENRWKGFTQSNARISRDVGGEFSIFDGSVMGTNVDLQHGKLIVQKWRFGSWPDDVFSTVKLTFEEPEPGVTIVKLVQTDVPEEDRYGNETVVENTERGWRDLIFHKIRAIFGFGL